MEREQSVPSVVFVIVVHPVGIDGLVVDPSRKAKITIKSPTRYPDGIVIVVASADALLIHAIAMRP
jgi:hypothetical protein